MTAADTRAFEIDQTMVLEAQQTLHMAIGGAAGPDIERFQHRFQPLAFAQCEDRVEIVNKDAVP